MPFKMAAHRGELKQFQFWQQPSTYVPQYRQLSARLRLSITCRYIASLLGFHVLLLRQALLPACGDVDVEQFQRCGCDSYC